MKAVFSVLILFLSCLVGTTHAEQTNPSTLKDYFHSGAYFKDIEKKLVDAKIYLDMLLQEQEKEKAPRRLAIVLDIDETALSNYGDLERLQFSQNAQARTAAYMMGNAIAITPVQQFYQFAIENEVAIFFVSERPNTFEVVNVTTKNLKQAGYTDWQELILKPLEKDKMSTQEFKVYARQQIMLQGYDIVLNIGDQDADLMGGHAQAKVKLPNPFYSV